MPRAERTLRSKDMCRNDFQLLTANLPNSNEKDATVCDYYSCTDLNSQLHHRAIYITASFRLLLLKTTAIFYIPEQFIVRIYEGVAQL